MLAFNLGVFFRNLQGQRVRLTAENLRERLEFVGTVRELAERTALTRHLSVVLLRGDLQLHIAFEESDESEEDAPQEVEMRLLLQDGDGEHELLHTAFAFDELRLQPEEAGTEAPVPPPEDDPPPPQAG